MTGREAGWQLLGSLLGGAPWAAASPPAACSAPPWASGPAPSPSHTPPSAPAPPPAPRAQARRLARRVCGGGRQDMAPLPPVQHQQHRQRRRPAAGGALARRRGDHQRRGGRARAPAARAAVSCQPRGARLQPTRPPPCPNARARRALPAELPPHAAPPPPPARPVLLSLRPQQTSAGGGGLVLPLSPSAPWLHQLLLRGRLGPPTAVPWVPRGALPPARRTAGPVMGRTPAPWVPCGALGGGGSLAWWRTPPRPSSHPLNGAPGINTLV